MRQIEASRLPLELPLFNGRVICATCHNPHLREAGEKRLREALDSSNLGMPCHRQ